MPRSASPDLVRQEPAPWAAAPARTRSRSGPGKLRVMFVPSVGVALGMLQPRRHPRSSALIVPRVTPLPSLVRVVISPVVVAVSHILLKSRMAAHEIGKSRMLAQIARIVCQARIRIQLLHDSGMIRSEVAERGRIHARRGGAPQVVPDVGMV